MDKLTTALLKAIGLVCIWCAIIILLFLCLYLTATAFTVSPFLGLFALFVDAVIVATFYYYDNDKMPFGGHG